MNRSASGNVKTSRLTKKVSGSNFRLSNADRAFLKDLAKTTVIDEVTANQFHYRDNASDATRRLDKLAEYGILEKSHTVDPTHGKIAYYEFSKPDVAKSFGGRCASIGINRQALHEIYVTRVYFDVGRPGDFRIAVDFDKSDYRLFGSVAPSDRNNFGARKSATMHFKPALEAAIPDAAYTDSNGEMVVVEADAGHYRSNQIAAKQNVWRNFKQVWAQPTKPAAVVERSSTVEVLQY